MVDQPKNLAVIAKRMLAWLAGGIAIIGVAFMALGLLAPNALHLA